MRESSCAPDLLTLVKVRERGMVSESDFALVVFFGVLSFLCTSTVLYKILASFTFSSSSIVAIYRMFSVQLVLISTVLFSMITGAKRTQWRCALSAFAVMYCNLSICASVLLLTKINRCEGFSIAIMLLHR